MGEAADDSMGEVLRMLDGLGVEAWDLGEQPSAMKTNEKTKISMRRNIDDKQTCAIHCDYQTHQVHVFQGVK